MKALFITCLALINITVFAQLKIPKDYEELTESPVNGKKMKTLAFNFDDDNILDYPTIIGHKLEFANYKLLMFLSTTKKKQLVKLLSLSDSEFNLYPTELKLNNNVLQFGYFLDGTSAFGRFIRLRYNKAIKKIQIIGYGSGYRASANGRIGKTFNLLTGKYIVNKAEFTINDGDKEIVKQFNCKDERFKNLYLENLAIKLLKSLDAVGNKFE